MRDPARIDRVLAMVRVAWLKAPDQRFGQLLVNVLCHEFAEEVPGDLSWFEGLEDYDWEHTLRGHLGEPWSAEQYARVVEEEKAKANAAWVKFFKEDMPRIHELSERMLREMEEEAQREKRGGQA